MLFDSHPEHYIYAAEKLRTSKQFSSINASVEFLTHPNLRSRVTNERSLLDASVAVGDAVSLIFMAELAKLDIRDIGITCMNWCRAIDGSIGDTC